MDKPGKDTYRMKAAGADSVTICSGGKLAIIETLPEEPSIEDILAKLQPVDLVLVEGYKKSRYPKIEIHRAVLEKPLLTSEEELLAVVTDEPLPVSKPQFGLDDAAGAASFLLNYVNEKQDG